MDDPDYWNHNTAYHRWMVGIASRRPGRVLDVGCGEGLLAQRLASVSRSVTGLEPHRESFARAQRRCSGLANVTLEATDFTSYDGVAGSFDLVVFVASLHHLELSSGLRRAGALLAPGGQLLVVGLAANRSALDWAWAILSLPLVRLGSWLHHETRDIGVPVADPREDLREIRAVAAAELPGARVRRGLYYRYLLTWARPGRDPDPPEWIHGTPVT